MSCYSFENVEIQTERASQLKDVVYITGVHDEHNTAGNGTAQYPYENFKVALKNVKPGGTIKVTGTFKYWKYEEASDLLYLPLMIDKEVTIEGAETNNVFIVRAPIQLGADVTFKNINIQMWASNEVFPGIPDSAFPQTPIDEETTFRSGRTIYLAGHKLTLENVDTRVHTASFQQTYRPYISGGTFRDRNEKTGNKAILDVKNTKTITGHSATEFAGIYAGDYWVERNYPVELNVKGVVLDKTIHTGGIMASSKGNVTINISGNTGVDTINNEKHDGYVDLNMSDEAGSLKANLNGIRNLDIGSGSKVVLAKDSKFEVENLTLRSNSLLDLREVSGNPKVTGNFIGETNTNLIGGSIFLANGKTLEINRNVEGTTKLNSFLVSNELLEENQIYVRAKENATGDFIIEPKYEQSNYKIIKNTSDEGYTTWKVYRDVEAFKEFRWISGDDVILKPQNFVEYNFYFDIINHNDESYLPVGDEWQDITITLTREDGTVLNDENTFDGEIAFGTYVDENNMSFACIEFAQKFIDKNTPEELILKISHKDGHYITKRIYVGKQKPDITILDVANVANKYNIRKGQAGYTESCDLNKDGIIDIYDITIISQYMSN